MATKNLYQRIAAVMRHASVVIKNKEIKAGNDTYKAATHNAVNRVLRPAMLDEGIIATISQMGEGKIFEGETKYGTKKIRFQALYAVCYVNIDDPTDRFTMEIEAHAEEYGDKAPGKAATYALKTAHMKTFFLESVDDDDEDRLPQHNNHLQPAAPARVIDMRETYRKAAEFLGVEELEIEKKAGAVLADPQTGEIPNTVIALAEPLAARVRLHLRDLAREHKPDDNPGIQSPGESGYQKDQSDGAKYAAMVKKRQRHINAKIKEQELDREEVKAGLEKLFGVESTGKLGGLTDAEWSSVIGDLQMVVDAGKEE